MLSFAQSAERRRLSGRAQFCFRATLALSLLQFWSFAGVHGASGCLALSCARSGSSCDGDDIVLVLLRAWSTWGRRTKVCIVLAAMFVVYASICVAIIIWGVIVGGGKCRPSGGIRCLTMHH